MSTADPGDVGVGIFLEESENGLVVSEVLRDGPAKDRLMEGDIVRAVVGANNKWIPTAGLEALQVARLIVGPPGTSVTLIVERTHGSSPSQRHSVTMTRGTVGPLQLHQLQTLRSASREREERQRGEVGTSKILLPEPSEEHRVASLAAPERSKGLALFSEEGRGSNIDTAISLRLMAEQLKWTSHKLDETSAELARSLEKLRVRDEETLFYKKRCKDLEMEIDRLGRAREDMHQVKRELDEVKIRVAGAHEDVLQRQRGEIRQLEEKATDMEIEMGRLHGERDTLRQTCTEYAGRCLELEGTKSSRTDHVCSNFRVECA
jgi:hypothetical protein